MTIRRSMVSFESGPDRLDGHLALPDGPGPHPAVVVIQRSARELS
jgi:dienelactone hydrolase